MCLKSDNFSWGRNTRKLNDFIEVSFDKEELFMKEICGYNKFCLCASCVNQVCVIKSCHECSKNGKAFVSKGKCINYKSK